ncbi:hypothetical protein AaE_001160, partial [Aphanomyces astaci]
MFADLLFKGLLAWLDNILGYTETPEDCLDLLDEVLTICSSFGLKLNSKKCDFFLAKAVWCVTVVSTEGVQHFCVARAHTLPQKYPRKVCARAACHGCRPRTVRDRDQLDAVQHPLLHRAELMAPLRQLLDAATKQMGSAKKTKLAHLTCFDKVKEALLAMVPMAHHMQTSWSAFTSTQVKAFGHS